jgi:RHS repeat-associated protein
VPIYGGNGNIMGYVDESGTLVAKFVYDPYGNVVSISDDIGNSAYAGLRGEDFSFGFSTKFHDREVGLIAYQLRSYSPALGRWLNRDPIEERGGVNLYGFCHNNSNVHYDGLGYEEIKSIIVKKKPIRWTKIYYSDVKKMNVADDLYGHWWIEIENESYGWWPIKKVGFWETLVGVPGEVNGISTFGGSSTRDPDHGQVPDVMYHPWRNVGLLKSNRLWYGPLKGDSCRCVNEDDIKKCIRDFALKFSRINGETWSYPFGNGNNCHDFVEKVLAACCLKDRP